MILPEGMSERMRAYVLADPQIPANALISGCITVTAYMREDGAQMWALHFPGDMTVLHAVGLLEVAKLELIALTPGVVTNLSPDDDEDESDV